MQQIFIIGSPRSGTSFTGRLFGCASRTLYWEESNIVWNLHYDELQTQDEVNAFLKYASMSWRLRGHEYTRNAFNNFHSFLSHGLRMDPDLDQYLELRGENLIKTVLRHYYKKDFKTFIEKTPTHTLYISDIKKHFPKSSIIHVYRHPLDVLSSIKEYSIANNIIWDVEGSALIWNDYFTQGSFNSTESISYHDLVFSKVIVQQLLERFGLDWTENTQVLYNRTSHVNCRNWDKRLTKKEIWQACKLIDWELASRAGFFPWG